MRPVRVSVEGGGISGGHTLPATPNVGKTLLPLKTPGRVSVTSRLIPCEVK